MTNGSCRCYIGGPNEQHRPPLDRPRRTWSYKIVRELVTKFGMGAGDQIELHVTDRYARYLQQRINTFGAEGTIPTAHRNLGQKLAWYTERIK